jgi:hypothetical protein
MTIPGMILWIPDFWEEEGGKTDEEEVSVL